AWWIAEKCAHNDSVDERVKKSFRFRDVALILRTTSSLDVYLDALKEAGIPYVVESDRYFYGTQEVIDFVNLLSVLDDPHDTVARSIAESTAEGESPLADEHLDAVRLLTIHKAKGLEYPIVIVPNLSAPGGARGAKRTCQVDWEEGVAGLRLSQAKAADIAMAFIERAEERRE